MIFFANVFFKGKGKKTLMLLTPKAHVPHSLLLYYIIIITIIYCIYTY